MESEAGYNRSYVSGRSGREDTLEQTKTSNTILYKFYTFFHQYTKTFNTHEDMDSDSIVWMSSMWCVLYTNEQYCETLCIAVLRHGNGLF